MDVVDPHKAGFGDDMPVPWQPRFTYTISVFCIPRTVENHGYPDMFNAASSLVEITNEMKETFPNVRFTLHIFGPDLSNFSKCIASIGTSEAYLPKKIGMLSELLLHHRPVGCVKVCSIVILDHCTGYQYVFVPAPKKKYQYIDGSDSAEDDEDNDVQIQRLYVDRSIRVQQPIPIPDPDDVSCARLQSDSVEGLQTLIHEMQVWAKDKGLTILHKEYNSDNTVADIYFHLNINFSALKTLLQAGGSAMTPKAKNNKKLLFVGNQEDDNDNDNMIGYVDAEMAWGVYVLEVLLKRYFCTVRYSKLHGARQTVKRLLWRKHSRRRWLRTQRAIEVVYSYTIRHVIRQDFSWVRQKIKLLQAFMRRKLSKCTKYRNSKYLAQRVSHAIKRCGPWRRWAVPRSWELVERSVERIHCAVRRYRPRNRFWMAAHVAAPILQRAIRAAIIRKIWRNITIQRRWSTRIAQELVEYVLEDVYDIIDTTEWLAASRCQACIRRHLRLKRFTKFRKTVLPPHFQLQYVAARIGWVVCRKAIHVVVAAVARTIVRRSYVAEQVLLLLAKTDQLQTRLLIQMLVGARHGMGTPSSLSDYCISMLQSVMRCSPFISRNLLNSRFLAERHAIRVLQTAARRSKAQGVFLSSCVLIKYEMAWLCRRSYRYSLRLLRHLDRKSSDGTMLLGTSALTLNVGNINRKSLPPPVASQRRKSSPRTDTTGYGHYQPQNRMYDIINNNEDHNNNGEMVPEVYKHDNQSRGTTVLPRIH